MDWILTVQTKSYIAKPLQKNVYTIEMNNAGLVKKMKADYLAKSVEWLRTALYLDQNPL